MEGEASGFFFFLTCICGMKIEQLHAGAMWHVVLVKEKDCFKEKNTPDTYAFCLKVK